MANYEYKVTIGDTPVTLVLKDFGDVPGRVSRRNVGNIEAQVWASLEWGLIEPEHWPLDSTRPGTDLFDDIAQRDATDCYMAWQKAGSK
jgi:hypothetical protein